ncbi:MAG: hypothetical protein AB7N71_07310 [Phycisphaerae bacterium]
MRKLLSGLCSLTFCSFALGAAPNDAMRNFAQDANAQAITQGIGAESTDGPLKVQSEQPINIELGGVPNDNCANATAFPCNSTMVVNNSGATTEPNDPIFTCQLQTTPGQGSGSVWYSITPTDTAITLSTCNSAGNDSMLLLLDGTCGNFTEIACNDDLPCGPSTFLSGMTVEGLTINDTYLLDVAAWGGGDVGEYTIELTCGAVLGACCTGANACTPDLTDDECFDAGGVWLGQDSLCADAIMNGTCVAAPACPPGSIIDNDGVQCGQPAPDNFNAGCASPSSAFQNLGGDGCGAVVCGQSSADDRNMSNRDTDWYLFTPVETTEYTACVTAQFFPQVQFWPLNPGIDPCWGVVPGIGEVGAPGELVCATACLVGGNAAAIRIAPVDANGDAQRSGIGCVDYVLEVTCDECALGACCGANNACVDAQTEADCISAGGEYLGDDSVCAGATCGGACCNQDGSCSDGISRQSCINSGGAYNGRESTCADVGPCPECVFEDPNDLDGLEGMNEDCTILGVDLVNSGCTGGAAGTDFSVIGCDQTVCGITAFDGGTRDLDWYHFTIASETEVLIELNNQMAEGNPLLWRLQWRMTQTGVPACDGGFNVTPTAAGDGLPPGSTFFSLVLSPARYTALVAYDFANQTALPPECPNGGRYRLSITCNDACTYSCVSTEGEGDCGVAAQLNSGCSVDPVGPFSPMTLDNPVCGTTRLVQVPDGMGGVTATRDIDWWQINIPTTGDYDFTLQAEFEALWFLQPLDGPMGCDDPAIFGFQIFQCADVTLTVTDLEAGNYAMFVGADFNSYSWFLTPPAQETCGSPYSLSVTSGGGDPCAGTVCADSNCDGVVSVSDIGFFVTAVAQGEAAWNAAHPGGMASCDFTCANDVNGDTVVSVSDIGPFVNAVTGGGCQ